MKNTSIAYDKLSLTFPLIPSICSYKIIITRTLWRYQRRLTDGRAMFDFHVCRSVFVVPAIVSHMAVDFSIKSRQISTFRQVLRPQSSDFGWKMLQNIFECLRQGIAIPAAQTQPRTRNVDIFLHRYQRQFRRSRMFLPISAGHETTRAQEAK